MFITSFTPGFLLSSCAKKKATTNLSNWGSLRLKNINNNSMTEIDNVYYNM